MMLDMKRTFDEVVIAHSTPEKADAILQNQFYVALSSQFSEPRNTWRWRNSGSCTPRRKPTAPGI